MRGLIGGIAAGIATAGLSLAGLSLVAPLPGGAAGRQATAPGAEAGAVPAPAAGTSAAAAPGAGIAGGTASATATPTAPPTASATASGAQGAARAASGAGAPEIAALPAGSGFDASGAMRAPVLGAPVGAPVAQAVTPPVATPDPSLPEPALLGTQPPARPEAGEATEAPQPAPDVAAEALKAAPGPEAPVPVPPPGEIETPALAPADPGPETQLAAAAAPGTAADRAAGTAADGAPNPAPVPPETVPPEPVPPETATPETIAPETATPGTDVDIAPDTGPAALPAADLPAADLPAFAADPAGGAPQLTAPGQPAPEAGGQTADQTAPQAPPQAGSEIVLLPDGSPVAPSAPTLPRVFRTDGQSAPQLAGAPAPGFADAEGVRVNRLPVIAPADPTAPAPGGEGGAITAPAAIPETDQPALRRYASAFAAPADLALLSIVLLDRGTAAGGLDPVTLKTLGLPVTVALDPGRPDAASVAAEYRAAGLEVAILAQPLPAGARPSDLEVALEAWHRALPEAIALVEPAPPVIQNDRQLSQQLTQALAREGLGLITQDQGLNAAGQIAGAEGLPGAEVWRVIDAGREDAPVVERMLGRAGFEAGREGRLVVMLSSWPQSVAGLVAWAASSPRGLALAPVSAQMQDGAF